MLKQYITFFYNSFNQRNQKKFTICNDISRSLMIDETLKKEIVKIKNKYNNIKNLFKQNKKF